MEKQLSQRDAAANCFKFVCVWVMHASAHCSVRCLRINIVLRDNGAAIKEPAEWSEVKWGAYVVRVCVYTWFPVRNGSIRLTMQPRLGPAQPGPASRSLSKQQERDSVGETHNLLLLLAELLLLCLAYKLLIATANANPDRENYWFASSSDGGWRRVQNEAEKQRTKLQGTRQGMVASPSSHKEHTPQRIPKEITAAAAGSSWQRGEGSEAGAE